VARLKVARIFNPLHVLGHPISVADIDSLKIFRLIDNPLVRPHIEGMKSEIIKYNTLVKSIKPLDQRKDAKDKDTFVLCDWWRCNSGELPQFAFVLRAVLTNAPNSCLSERLFSMYNAAFGEDQQRSFGDYLELAMQAQSQQTQCMSLRACVTVVYFPVWLSIAFLEKGSTHPHTQTQHRHNTHTHAHTQTQHTDTTRTHMHRRL